tara:strand:+ start:386 stop:823 length:438 start_codon:yes stop_codon:yes gene_type:complete
MSDWWCREGDADCSGGALSEKMATALKAAIRSGGTVEPCVTYFGTNMRLNTLRALERRGLMRSYGIEWGRFHVTDEGFALLGSEAEDKLDQYARRLVSNHGRGALCWRTLADHSDLSPIEFEKIDRLVMAHLEEVRRFLGLPKGR